MANDNHQPPPDFGVDYQDVEEVYEAFVPGVKGLLTRQFLKGGGYVDLRYPPSVATAAVERFHQLMGSLVAGSEEIQNHQRRLRHAARELKRKLWPANTSRDR